MDASLANERIRLQESDHYSGRQQQRPQLEIKRSIESTIDLIVNVCLFVLKRGTTTTFIVSFNPNLLLLDCMKVTIIPQLEIKRSIIRF